MIFYIYLAVVAVIAIWCVIRAITDNWPMIRENLRGVGGFYYDKRRWYYRPLGVWQIIWRIVVWPFPAVGIGAMVLLFASLIYSGVMGSTGKVGHTDDKTKLAALAVGGQQIEGRFFLGSGYVDGHRVLNYMGVHGDRFRLDSTPTDNADIIQDATPSTAYLLHASWYREDASGFWFPFPVKIDGDSGMLHGIGKESWEYHVPAGSVLTGDFTVDNSK